MELLGKTNIDFIGKRNIAFAISAVIAILGIIGIIQISRGAANMGIDFSGGTSMQLKFTKPMPIADARSALQKNGIAKAELQEIKDGNKLLIKIDKAPPWPWARPQMRSRPPSRRSLPTTPSRLTALLRSGLRSATSCARTPWWR
jgi:hypothetical protein